MCLLTKLTITEKFPKSGKKFGKAFSISEKILIFAPDLVDRCHHSQKGIISLKGNQVRILNSPAAVCS